MSNPYLEVYVYIMFLDSSDSHHGWQMVRRYPSFLLFCLWSCHKPSTQVNSSKKSECESAKTIYKLHRQVTGQFSSMDHSCLRRFGENFEKMFPDFFLNATFSNSNRSSTDLAWSLHCKGIKPRHRLGSISRHVQ